MKLRTAIGLGWAGLAVGAAAMEVVPGEAIVAFQPGHAPILERSLARAGARMLEHNGELGIARVKLPKAATDAEGRRQLQAITGVRRVEPNAVVRTALVPNDPHYALQYSPQRILSESAWAITRGAPDVVIAIVDTGIDFTHPDLASRIVPGWDFIGNDNIAADDHGHGTHCAGIAAAGVNNGIGIAGIAGGCAIMPVKVLNADGVGTLFGIANGITWAAQNGAKVISLSLGTTTASSTLESAVNFALSRGAVVVAAAGNMGNSTRFFPAAFDGSIAVGSSDSLDQRSSFSNFGDWVDVAAPGSAIYSTLIGGGYGLMSGTSMATPAVAGLAAQLFSALGTGTSPALIRQRIETSADPIGNWLNFGRINARRALGGEGNGLALSLSSDMVSGGEIVNGTVTLPAPAPIGGVPLRVETSDPQVATVPETLRVPAGATQISFQVGTRPVGTSRVVQIRAIGAAGLGSSGVQVRASAGLRSISVPPGSARPGGRLRLSVLLTGPAGPGGFEVNLTSFNPAVIALPATVRVPEGQNRLILEVPVARSARSGDVVLVAMAESQSRLTRARVRR